MKSPIIGQQFGYLTVTKYLGRSSKHTRAYFWECLCSCGTITQVRAGDLNKRGNSQSCGCKKRELQSWKKQLFFKKKGTYQKDAFYNRLIVTYDKSAKIRQLPWDLSRECCIVLFNSNCFYCGAAPYKKLRSRSNLLYYTYTGIDRLDPTKGYLENNVVACCSKCNRAKGEMQFDEFFQWIERIYKHIKTQNNVPAA